MTCCCMASIRTYIHSNQACPIRKLSEHLTEPMASHGTAGKSVDISILEESKVGSETECSHDGLQDIRAQWRGLNAIMQCSTTRNSRILWW